MGISYYGGFCFLNCPKGRTAHCRQNTPIARRDKWTSTHRPFTPFSPDSPPFSRIFAAKQVQKWEGCLPIPLGYHLMVITMIALPILNVSLTSFSSIMVGFWTCFSYSLLPPTKPQIPTQHPTPQPLAPQNPTSHFTNQKVQKRRFVGIAVGLTPPGNGDSPASGRTFASIQRDGDLFFAHP